MIDFSTAIEIAKIYFAKKGLEELTKVYDADKIWVIYAGKKDQLRFGNSGIAVDKETGEISTFILPSRINFEILKNATLIEI